DVCSYDLLNEPSIVAVDNITNKVVAVGNDAKNMVGRTPKNISSIRPLKEGVIADYDITTEMLKYLLKKVSKKIGHSLRKPTIIICTPSSSTNVERRAIHNAVAIYGAKYIHLIEEPIVTAIAADLHVE